MSYLIFYVEVSIENMDYCTDSMDCSALRGQPIATVYLKKGYDLVVPVSAIAHRNCPGPGHWSAVSNGAFLPRVVHWMNADGLR